jgi:hypothetical protein
MGVSLDGGSAIFVVFRAGNGGVSTDLVSTEGAGGGGEDFSVTDGRVPDDCGGPEMFFAIIKTTHVTSKTAIASITLMRITSP